MKPAGTGPSSSGPKIGGDTMKIIFTEEIEVQFGEIIELTVYEDGSAILSLEVSDGSKVGVVLGDVEELRELASRGGWAVQVGEV